MEREISTAIEISVALIALSALLFIVWFTVFLGKDIANDASVVASDVVVVTETGQLQEMCEQENIMPASAAYSILRTNSAMVGSYVCNLHAVPNGPVSLSAERSPCILKHLTGKVSLKVKYAEEGWFSVEVHHMNCNWYNGTCNCYSLLP